ncbi:AbfB domain-containing protein [Streptomyces sp. 900105755]|uniref:AbfB domain-containing protein n=1 Tax=Streptomyces sp. Ag109_O5-10 TaxID=1855349 RepID=UPI00089CF93D|nr:AbfB domain-containing protein [Streptomyces sp. Ag109_O5-10]SEF11822.1 Alpha-L-arabinofuranosidase B (ABFB) domain-containing protein [Streptomyces sp. Ag109_O5-10]
MPETTPQPPPHPAWENGWAPDTSRAPGTRRLWLAGTLAVATVVACVTAISVSHNAPDQASPNPTATANTDNGPGLLSFASPSTPGTTAPPKGTSGMSATSPSASASQSGAATATSSGAGPKSSPSSAKPTKSTPSKGSSGGSGGSGQQPGSSGESVRSVNYPDRYWHVSGSYVYLDQPRGSESREDSTFDLVKGLANASCYSFATHDGLYLRHQNFVLRAERNDGSSLFRQDATFCPQKSPYSDDVLFQSVNYPNYALRHKNFQLRLDPFGYNTTNRQDFFFDLVDGLS